MHRPATGSSPFVGRERETLLALSEGLAADAAAQVAALGGGVA